MASSIPTTPAAESASASAPAAVVTQTRRRPGARLFRIGGEIPRSAYSAIAAASFILPLLLWCFFTYSGRANSLVLPTPTRVVVAAIDMFQSGALLPDIQISVYRIGMGFFLSALLAIPIGILMGAYKSAEAAHEPLVGFIRYVPVPALIPLVMVIAGIDEAAKITLIFIGTYFQMVLVVADVTRQVPRDLLNAARTLGANGRQLLFNVLLPATLPGLLDTCRTMIGWAWTYLVIAEVVATSSGMGYMLLKAQRFSRSDEMFVGIIILGVLGLLTDIAFKLIQPRLVPWAELNKN